MVTLSFVLSAGNRGAGRLRSISDNLCAVRFRAGLAIKGFTVAILGGLGNSMAAVAAGDAPGILESFSIWVMPTPLNDVNLHSNTPVILFVKTQRPFRSKEASA